MLEATVRRFYFQSQETGYGVAVVSTRAQEAFVAVGPLGLYKVGERIALEGEFVTSEKFGQQFRVASAVPVQETGADIEHFLASGLISGIGPTRARAICSAFGAEAATILSNGDTATLQTIRGIGQKTAATMVAAWRASRGTRDLMILLLPHGIKVGAIARIQRTFGAQALSLVRENPYKIIGKVWGVGFKSIDACALSLGIPPDSSLRRAAIIVHILHEAESEGHTCLTLTAAHDRVKMFVADDAPWFPALVKDLVTEDRVVLNDDHLYLPDTFMAETDLAGMIGARLGSPARSIDANVVRSWCASFCAAQGIEANEEQVAAVLFAATTNLLILTGGPGTGKTTTVNMILSYWEAHDDLSVALCAPTGRAAQRLAEVTASPAVTIHRLLESDGSSFRRGASYPIDADAVVIDESSMLDIDLAHALFSAIDPGARVLLVGDRHQLPSVGAGNVLGDLIASAVIPVVELVKIHRNVGRIVEASHALMKGTVPDLSPDPASNLRFLRLEYSHDAASRAIRLIEREAPGALSDHLNDIQILSPMRKGELGTDRLNQVVQSLLHGQDEPSITVGQGRYYVGDRVMQLRNNYDFNVFNGDLGTVVGIHDHLIEVSFDGTVVSYERIDFDQITLAYAITVHKSQGSEYPVVAMVVSSAHTIMLRRNLVYTGLTRAKRLCLVLGTRQALASAIAAAENAPRTTRLASHIAAVTQGR